MIKLEIQLPLWFGKLNNPQVSQLPVNSVVASWTVEPVAFTRIFAEVEVKCVSKGLVFSMECLGYHRFIHVGTHVPDIVEW